MEGSRRHSVSGDHSHPGHNRHDRYDRENAFGPREPPVYRGRHHHDDENAGSHVHDHRREHPRHASANPRGYSPDRRSHRHHSSSRRSRHDDGYDTDYNPRDKYYLSGEDDTPSWRNPNPNPNHHRVRDPRRDAVKDDHLDRDSRRSSEPVKEQRGSSPHRAPRRSRTMMVGGDSGASHHRGSSHDRRDSRDRDHRDGRDQHDARGRHPSRPGGPTRRISTSAPATHSRSSHRQLSSSKPPHHAEGSSRSRSKSAIKSGGHGMFDIQWSTAARCALEAGTMTALKVHDKPGAWLGTKGAQIATAAVGAALVDGYIAQKNPGMRGGKRHAVLRQVTNAAIGTLVLTPAGKSVERQKPLRHIKQHLPMRVPVKH